MNEYHFEVRLTLRAPILSQASGARAYGVDTASLRDGGNHPALPGSLVRGNLRHAWKDLRDRYPRVTEIPSEDEVKAWLGDKSEEGGDNRPNRGRLRFAEHWCADRPGESGVRHRAERDPNAGAVAGGSLQVIESPFAAGEKVVYVGWIKAWCRDDTEAGRLGQWIRKGLEYMPALGALKGTGFGRVLAVELSTAPISVRTAGQSKVDSNATAFGIRLKLDRPFCFARSHLPNSNRYESEEFIPGGAIIGALARRLRHSGVDSGLLDHPDYPALCRHFDSLGFTQGFAVAEASSERPVVLPLSLVIGPTNAAEKASDDLYDVALKGAPGLIHHQAPAFSADWKDKHLTMAYQKCGWGAPLVRSLIVRTEIDPYGAAEEEKLFATECVVPQGHGWLATVNLNKIDDGDRSKVIDELERLLSTGLDRLGKTEAEAQVELLPQRPALAVPCHPIIHDNLAIVALQSAARLLPHAMGIPPTNGGSELFSEYEGAWRELSGNSLRLLRFYARQQLVGGEYLWTRFQHREQPYTPELLTLAGSVFVLKVLHETNARQKLNEWLRNGLPQLTGSSGGEDWKKTPYLAANGYGEIAVNLKLHWEWEPKDGEQWYGLE